MCIYAFQIAATTSLFSFSYYAESRRMRISTRRNETRSSVASCRLLIARICNSANFDGGCLINNADACPLGLSGSRDNFGTWFLEILLTFKALYEYNRAIFELWNLTIFHRGNTHYTFSMILQRAERIRWYGAMSGCLLTIRGRS